MSEFDLILDNSQQNLQQLPDEILNFSNLRMLYLQGNFIDTLPDNFFTKLSKLTWLDLRDNRLKIIPKSIRSHQHLENLLLTNNQIEYLPNELGFVPKLKVLQVANNPLKYPDCGVIAGGTKAICDYLKSQFERLEVDQIQQTNLDNRFKDTGSNTELSLEEAVIPISCKQSNDCREIVQRVPKDSAKVQLRSARTITSDEDLKGLWMDKLRALLEEQEKVLQQERNVKALSHWKYKKFTPKLNQPRRQPPYGTDTVTIPRKPVNIDDLIQNLAGELKNIERLQNTTNNTKIEEIGEQIKTIMVIHKKLKQLKNPL